MIYKTTAIILKSFQSYLYILFIYQKHHCLEHPSNYVALYE